MPVFSSAHFDNHEEVVFCRDAESGLNAIIAIHDTTLGAGLGGCRFWPYADEEEALTDALRLSRGMTYKAALAGTGRGGGKSVIMGSPRDIASPDLFRALGRFVDSLGGRYVIAEDVGTSPADMAHVRESTRFVAGLAGGSGDPSPATALGTFVGIRAALKHRRGSSDLKGVRVAVQGLGHVGWDLCRQLHAAGAHLTVADIRDDVVERAVSQFGASATDSREIHAADVDVFAPCALGAVINDRTVDALKAGIVAGSANNQLAEDWHGDALAARGVLYAPDYVINAGGIINIAHEGPGYDQAKAFRHVEEIGRTLTDLFRRSDSEGLAPHTMADRMAGEVIARAKDAKRRLAA
ncbi:Glu/Leu/Phe/Val dehydrogenase dimerization domain-containing protein [Minwuia sp.]|uniref:Glu/Leu/Phe/Val dehydrogenase dimerization domain-containing protein n=1 Tax=Minwuia sp. TaxID=2493630 RepID=UPI003A8D2FF1